MANRKQNFRIYFSVEGETEKWYLNWLQQQINASDASKLSVKFDVKVEKDPVKRIKQTAFFEEATFIHFFDIESQEAAHVQQVQTTLDRLKLAKEYKPVTYKLAYSNFAFELWILLHKCAFTKSLTHRSQYLQPINKTFGENFENLHQCKHQDNFARILSKLTLSDVVTAIKNAKTIEDQNALQYKAVRYKGCSYYKENPSLSVGRIIEEILQKCGLVGK